jgi:succinylglutamic semialdehyde dehydrogenase
MNGSGSHGALAPAEGPADLVDGRWEPLAPEGSGAIASANPARPAETVWRGVPRMEHVGQAVASARRALPAWAALPFEARAECLRGFAERCTQAVPELAALITREVGKTLAESTLEAKLLAEKVAITLEPGVLARVRGFEVPAGPTRTGHCRFKPLGVMAVIGPFNFPAHLPNGHIVPALLLGNAVVFKPSEKAPAVGQRLAGLLGASVPPGVVNLVHGGGAHAAALVAHPDVDGVLFTGSWPVGRRILEANLDRPGRMVALEMGGSNAAVVLDDANLALAVPECVRAAFATTGQRCTCTRRIVVERGIAEEFLRGMVALASRVTFGPGDADPPVFMGPLVTREARDAALEFQRALVAKGARAWLEARPGDGPGWFLSPGVLQVDRFTRTEDREVFGPIVQVAVAEDLDDAIAQANATDYGLAASIFTASRERFERFFAECRAGCINWNTGTAGASSRLPFGGLGHSGNLRPAGAFSVDACAVPVASMVETGAAAAPLPGLRGA